MSQVNLATKYRPKAFADIVGQEVTVSVLCRQIENNSLRNVYLFCGPRGCGKTSTARLLANAVNDNMGDPIEIDAASNNGVDDMRKIKYDAQMAPIGLKYKVYIIDEAHMLTTAAWNASLKLLEEPPEHVIFIFCTTNPNKLPETVLSRAQRFDFKKVPCKAIADRLEFICNEEAVVEYDRLALDRISYLSNGFMRDAISLFNKCFDYSNVISLENVEKVLGLVHYDALIQLFDNIIDNNVDNAITILNNIKANTTNSLDILDNIVQFTINVCIFQSTKDIFKTTLPEIYIDKLNTFTKSFVDFMNISFKFRQLIQTLNTDDLLNILIISLCNGGTNE